MADQPRCPKAYRVSVVQLAAAMVLILGMYVLSYAPVVRLKAGAGPAAVRLSPRGTTIGIDGDDLLFYKPIDTLIDHSPLARKVLWYWASWWRVDRQFHTTRLQRQQGRNFTHPGQPP